MAWSSLGRAILVDNLCDGIDVYRLHLEQPTFEQKLLIRAPRHHYPQQVVFSQSDQLAISGSDRGVVHVWDVDSGALVQVLRHSGKPQ